MRKWIRVFRTCSALGLAVSSTAVAVRIQFKKLNQQAPKFGAAFGGDRMEALAKMGGGAPQVPDAPTTPPAVPPPEGGEAAPAVEAPAPVAVTPPTEAAPEGADTIESVREIAATAEHAEFQLPVPPSSMTTAGAADEPVSEAIMNHSRKPGLMRAMGTILKWSFLGGVLLAGGFYLMRGILFPVVKEMRRDKNAPVVVDKEASTLVQSVQQTRQVIAKNDAKVEYLEQIMDGEKEKPVAAVPAPAPVAPPTPAPVAQVVVPKERNLARCQEAVAQYEVSGVREGPPPRLFHGGVIVKFGDIVDYQLGLRFIGVDADERVVLFANGENDIFRKAY